MKKILFLSLMLSAFVLRAQTNSLSLSSAVSNIVVAPYFTHTEHGDWGGGVLLVYNINDYVGIVAGLDDVNRLQLLSGGIELRKSFLVAGKVVTPFAIAAMGTPMSGAGNDNNGLSTVTAAGVNVDLLNYKGWTFGIGGAFANWTNAGKESGQAEEGFVKVSKGF